MNSRLSLSRIIRTTRRSNQIDEFPLVSISTAIVRTQRAQRLEGASCCVNTTIGAHSHFAFQKVVLSAYILRFV